MKTSSIISLASAAASIVAPAIAAAVAELESGVAPVARSATRRHVKSGKAKSSKGSGSSSSSTLDSDYNYHHPQTANLVPRPSPSSSKSSKKSSAKADKGYETIDYDNNPQAHGPNNDTSTMFPFYHHQTDHLPASIPTSVPKGNYYLAKSGKSSPEPTKSSSKSSVEEGLVLDNEHYGLFHKSPSKSAKSSSKSGKAFSKSSKASNGEIESTGLFGRPPSKSAKSSFKSGKAFSKSSKASSKSAKSASKSGKVFSKSGKAFDVVIESAGESHSLFDATNWSNTREIDTLTPSGVPTTPPTTRLPTPTLEPTPKPALEPTRAPSPLSITKSLEEEKSEFACTADPCPISTWCRSRQGTCGPDNIYCGGPTTWTSTCPPNPTAGPTTAEPVVPMQARPALRSASPAGPMTTTTQPTLRPTSLPKMEASVSFVSPSEEMLLDSDSDGILEEKIGDKGSIDPLDSQLGARVDPSSSVEDTPAGLSVANMVIVAVAAALAALVGLLLATSYARRNHHPVDDGPPDEESHDAVIA